MKITVEIEITQAFIESEGCSEDELIEEIHKMTQEATEQERPEGLFFTVTIAKGEQ